MPKLLSEEVKREATRLYVEERMQPRHIRDRLGIGATTVTNLLRRAGIQPRDASESRIRLHDPAAIVKMYDAGMSTIRIARALGVSTQAVKTALDSMHVKYRPRSAYRGKMCNQWKGGRRLHPAGYIEVYDVARRRYALEHRLLMERFLGRPIPECMDVHHVNGDKSDNRIENLQLLPKGEHSALHNAIRRGVRT